MVGGKVLEQEKVAVQMRDPGIADDIAENRQDLIGVQDPLFDFKPVLSVEATDAFRDLL